MSILRTVLRGSFFYPVVFGLWVGFVLLQFRNHPYEGLPFPSVVPSREPATVLRRKQIIARTIDGLREMLAHTLDGDQKLHVLHNIGISYYDRYQLEREPSSLDSAQMYFSRSVENRPRIAPFYYNLGRAYTVKGNHQEAARAYAVALSVDSNHVLALHNLAIVQFFEFGMQEEPRRNLQRLLRIDSGLPIANYILGEIYLRNGDLPTAITHYRQEAKLYPGFAKRAGEMSVASESVRYCSAMSHLRLAVLFSTSRIDRDMAQENLHRYLSLETDPARRRKAIEEMKRYWDLR